jgi:hypothetical protein
MVVYMVIQTTLLCINFHIVLSLTTWSFQHSKTADLHFNHTKCITIDLLFWHKRITIYIISTFFQGLCASTEVEAWDIPISKKIFIFFHWHSRALDENKIVGVEISKIYSESTQLVNFESFNVNTPSRLKHESTFGYRSLSPLAALPCTGAS